MRFSFPFCSNFMDTLRGPRHDRLAQKLAIHSIYDGRKWRDLSKGRWEAKNHGIGGFSEVRSCLLGEGEELSASGPNNNNKRKEPPQTDDAYRRMCLALRLSEDASPEPAAPEARNEGSLPPASPPVEGTSRDAQGWRPHVSSDRVPTGSGFTGFDGTRLADVRSTFEEAQRLYSEALNKLKSELLHREVGLQKAKKLESLEFLESEIAQIKCQCDELKARVDAQVVAEKAALSKASAFEAQLRVAHEYSLVRADMISSLKYELQKDAADARADLRRALNCKGRSKESMGTAVGGSSQVIKNFLAREPFSVNLVLPHWELTNSGFPTRRSCSLEFLTPVPECLGRFLDSGARGLRELTELYGPSLSLSLGLHTVLETRRSLGLEQSAITCFRAARVSTILIDDGIELDKMVDIEWHKKVVPIVGRILRVEHLAEKILDKAADGTTWTLDSFMEIFTKELKSVADNVVAFKSMVACRSGLAINTEVTQKEAEEGLSDVLRAGNPIRISNKSFIDYIFIHALEVAQSYDLPMQIHMGFGDKDFDMMLANPLYLHNLLEDKRFTNSRLVLLHASYPFSKEASHLASAYPQVYLDFGFAIPKLSFHGMISSLKELLKLAPMNKVMFSTDAIAFAEAFYLGAKRAREAAFSVLRDAMVEGDLSITKAVAAVKDIFAENAKKFYKLHKLDVSSKDSDIEPHIPSPFIKEELHGSLKDSSTDSDVEPCILSYFQSEELYGSSKDVTLVRIIWIGASGQHRCRGVPQQRFYSFVKKHGIGLPRACMGISSISDYPVEDTTLTCSGLFTIVPDLSTKCRIPWAKEQEMVLANMCTKSGEPWEYCPREALRRISKILKDEFGLVMTAGFEVEFYLLESVINYE
ncbi:PREDICTED: protein fluG-like [Nicotiana attenuata]|uniref:protein fluG-like n=1 Tax=Nicotiana attenuata TaxID=49451 RepID=UPI000904D5F4|nr:PREDICTED: protein fluG-like [Nicotiana attenuata]